MTGRPTAPALTAPLVDDAFYADDPFPTYARLRREAPVVWHQPDGAPGWWVVSTLPEVLEVSRDPSRFCSGKGILTFEIGVEYPSPPTMMHTDPPDHTRYRKLVQPGFAPSRIRALEAPVRALARRFLDDLAPDAAAGPVDVVPRLAEPYPVHVIADLLGVPDEDRDRFVLWSDATIPGASDLPPERCAELMAEMQAYLMAAGRYRRGGEGDGGRHADLAAEAELDRDRERHRLPGLGRRDLDRQEQPVMEAQRADAAAVDHLRHRPVIGDAPQIARPGPVEARRDPGLAGAAPIGLPARLKPQLDRGDTAAVGAGPAGMEHGRREAGRGFGR